MTCLIVDERSKREKEKQHCNTAASLFGKRRKNENWQLKASMYEEEKQILLLDSETVFDTASVLFFLIDTFKSLSSSISSLGHDPPKIFNRVQGPKGV